MTRDQIMLRYSRGQVSFTRLSRWLKAFQKHILGNETLAGNQTLGSRPKVEEKLPAPQNCSHQGVSMHPDGYSCTDCGCDLRWNSELEWYVEQD